MGDNDRISKERVKEALATIMEEIIESLPIDWEVIPSIEATNSDELNEKLSTDDTLGKLDANEKILYVIKEYILDTVIPSNSMRFLDRRKNSRALLDTLLCYHAKVRLDIYDAEVAASRSREYDAEYFGVDYAIRKGWTFVSRDTSSDLSCG